MARNAFEDNMQMDGDGAEALHHDSTAARRAARAGLGMMSMAMLIAAMWIGAAGAAAWLVIGPQALMNLSRLEMAGLGLAATLPAALIVFCGMAAREGARARAEARRLADAAERMLNPSPAARSAATRVGAAVRQEIEQLDRALNGVLSRLRESQLAVSQQSAQVDAAAERARGGAQSMILGMERERDALVQIATDLNAQASLISDQITRHARILGDAARTAETEVRAADLALDQRLGSFSAATQLIGDRTHALHAAAQASSDSALRLEGALSNALDVLAKASSLTDAARQNVEHAGRAADSTASAVRDTTARAIDDARHAADIIRAEAAAMEREASRAIERLKEAAHAARSASDDVRAAAGVAVAANLSARHAPAPPPEGPNRGRGGPDTLGVAPIDDIDAAWNRLEQHVSHPQDGAPRAMAAVAEAPAPVKPRRPSFAEQLSGVAFTRHTAAAPAANANPPPRKPDRNTGGGWRWRDMLAAIDREDRKAESAAPKSAAGAAAKASAEPASTTVSPELNPFDRAFAPEPASADASATARPEPRHRELGAHEPGAPTPGVPVNVTRISAAGQSTATIVGFARHPLPIVGLLEGAGFRLSDVFSPTSLDRIAARARNGTQARRRAVREAAGEAVMLLETRLRTDPTTRAEAGAFLRSEGARIAELLGRGRAAMTADATRAFLLLDAASV